MRKWLVILCLSGLASCGTVFAHPFGYGGHNGFYPPPPPPPHHKMHKPQYYGGAMIGRRWNAGNRCYFNSNVGYYNGIPWYTGGRGVFNSGFTLRF